MKETVHILGGGMAGLAAAIQLIQYGITPVIVEKNNYLGGRVRSFADLDTGDEIDNGQHLLMRAYQDTNWLLQLVGTASLIEYQEFLKIPYKIFNPEGRLSEKKLTFSGFKFPFNLMHMMFNRDFFTFSERMALLKLFLGIRKAGENQTVEEVLEEIKIPETVKSSFLQPFVEAALNTKIHEASARMFWKTIESSFFNNGKHAALGFPTRGLSHVFAYPAEKYILEHGGRIMKKNLIKKINFTSEDYISGLVDNDGLEIPVKFLISTVPFVQLKKICPIFFMDKIAEPILTNYNYSSIISAYVWSNKPLFHEAFFAISGKTIQWIFNKRVYGGPFRSNFHLYQVTISAANNLDYNHLLLSKIIKDELKAIFPLCKDEDIVRIKIIRDKNATPLASPLLVNNQPEITTPVKNLFLAGDWVRSGLPATIEAAVKTGREAAHKIISSFFWEN